MKALSLLGSTGSIGRNVLAVVRQFPDRFCITGLAAGRQINLLAEQVIEFEPEYVSVADASLVKPLADKLPFQYRSRILHGVEGNCTIAALPSTDMVVSAVVGSVGLLPALAAIKAGKDIGLANKETLVMAGRLIMDAAHRCRVRLLPIDSEHSAIFQALEAGQRQDVTRIILTASGGPFRTWSRKTMETATPDQALAHPNWNMGKKISIDSATLMNKGLEVIEARWLFDMDPEKIEVVVHPQSIVHSLVEFRDGAVVAQLGVPDMRIPIAYVLTYPERLDLGLAPLNLTQCGHLTFEQPDSDRFPALALAYRALAMGGVKPAVLNAANEVAVGAFLAGRIGFSRITEIVGTTLEKTAQGDELDLEAILAADAEARAVADREILSS